MVSQWFGVATKWVFTDDGEEEERVPFKEGWRRSEKPVTQGDMNHMILSLVSANEHKAAEAEDVGFGTVQAIGDAVASLMPSYCTVM